MLKRHKKKLIALAVLVAAGFYLFWPGLKPNLSEAPALHLKVTASYGTDTGSGNVVGIEPYMEPLDYATPDRFQAKIDGYLAAAKQKGWLKPGTIVLLPEHIGTWLLAAGQGNRVYDASSSSEAMLPIITHNLPQFLKNLFIFDDPDNTSAALIRTRTRASADAQLKVYGALSRKYDITLVAGSSALMTPGVYPDSLSYGHGPIFNAGFVFGPDGVPQEDAVRKVHPIPSETGFTTGSKPEFLPTFSLADYKFGVMICADSWFDDTTSYMAGEGVELLLVPSFLTDTMWDAPWQGYLNDAPPGDAWKADIGKITEGEAWVKYALPAKAERHGIQWGMNVFLKGSLWDLKGSGRALILEGGTLHIGEGGDDGAALYNLWLK
ncbi:nitrilase-related carbon-nitrogen hydrolase [Kordiimonas lipolytica]|uniref:Nitrilase-related carbon-nitrogen hydrolase n=1 Tax=Kordiimonas lipolytica TaxID=1662421 RepID=A0ABV8UC41_9PROT|nr:nitrilase-related carbon-nitrogen hydrolase [Kordiimonas lipolytica]